MDDTPTAQEAKDAYRDAASLMLYLFRDEVENIKAISDANDNPGRLLSGMIAVCAMITRKAFEDDAVEVLEGLVAHLASLDDSEWEQVAEHSRTVK